MIGDPRVAPEREQARSSGYAAWNERIDGPRKRPTSCQPGREQPPGERQADVDPEIPGRPPDAAREAELEHRDRPARAHDARELGERRRGIVDVPEEVGERQVVERGVGKRQRVGRRLDELDAAVEPLAGASEHLGALVEAGDAKAPREQPRRDEPGARRHVEHAAAVGRAGARRGTAASADPGRTRAPRRPGRTSGRAARRARVRGRLGRTSASILARWASPDDLERIAAAAAGDGAVTRRPRDGAGVRSTHLRLRVRGAGRRAAPGSRSTTQASRSATGVRCATPSRSPRSARSPRRRRFPAISTSSAPSSSPCASPRRPRGSRRRSRPPAASSTCSGAPPHLATPCTARRDRRGGAAARARARPDGAVAVHVGDAERRGGRGRAVGGRRGRVPRAATLTAMEGGGFFPFGGDPEEILRGPTRLRRAAGRGRQGGAARAVRDADALDRGRADPGGDGADRAGRHARRAGAAAARRDARALPRGGRARLRRPPGLHARMLPRIPPR